MRYLLLWMFAAIICLPACNLEKVIEVDLPAHDSQLVVECYLEHGKPYRLLLTESVNYFSSPTLPDIDDATVVITHQGQSVVLEYKPQLDTLTGKIYNYASDALVDSTGGGTYRLEISDTRGRRITAETAFLPKVPITEITWEFEDKDKEEKDSTAKALLLIRHSEDPEQENYYRMRILRDSAQKLINELDFVYRGLFATNGELTLGTAYRFEDKDTLQVLLYHIDRRFYDYFRTIDDAVDANGNPFAPPANIISGVEGGWGVFAALSYDQKTVVVRKDSITQRQHLQPLHRR
ncbi:DUF4249 domain-containing protein [Thermonema rossianum]|uniref:DUF4249 domain-containing protein n=1 Tax=Thermonema rossianum TaxID=55505 RepID=UPI00056F07F2|nr:DUF4249 domain-containing protein [Thermonema rossianum]